MTPAHIVPEWYFLPFYAILRAIPDKLGGVIAMFGAIAVLVFLPWLDTSRVRSAVYRPIYRQFFWIFVAGLHRPRLSRLAAAGGRLCHRRAHPDRLLLRALPDHPAAARPDRETEAAAGLDRRGRAGVEGRRACPRGEGAADEEADAMSAACVLFALAPASASLAHAPAAGRGGEAADAAARSAGRSPARSATSTGRSCSAASRSIARSARPATG